MTSQQVCKSSHLAHIWHHILSTSHHIHTLWHQWSCFMTSKNTAFMTSYLLYMTSLPLFRASHHFLYDLKSTVSDVTSTVSVSSHPFCWWYHTKCLSVITSAIILDIISIVYYMTATLWHHNRCIHDIRFPTYDITSRVYDILSPIPVTSQTLCMRIHVNNI